MNGQVRIQMAIVVLDKIGTDIANEIDLCSRGDYHYQHMSEFERRLIMVRLTAWSEWIMDAKDQLVS